MRAFTPMCNTVITMCSSAAGFMTRAMTGNKKSASARCHSTRKTKSHYQWSLFTHSIQYTTTVRDDTYQVGLHYSRKLERTAISYVDYYNSILDVNSSHAWSLRALIGQIQCRFTRLSTTRLFGRNIGQCGFQVHGVDGRLCALVRSLPSFPVL